MMVHDNRCSMQRPSTLGGISWILVPITAREGDNADEQIMLVRKCSEIRQAELESLEPGSDLRRSAARVERSIRGLEWYERRDMQGYESVSFREYVQMRHFELVWPD